MKLVQLGKPAYKIKLLTVKQFAAVKIFALAIIICAVT